MRRTRRLLLLVILLIAVGVGVTYHVRRGLQERSAAPPPKSLPGHISAAADYWSWSQTDGNRPIVEVRARNFRQIKEPSRFELEDVELRLFRKDGKSFDKVRSRKADFDLDQKLLHSPGDVEITMAVPLDETPKARLLVIRSSGVTFETATGKARTDQPASFTFDTAEGQAVGATYDPSTRELALASQVRLDWRGRGPHAQPMHIESGSLLYKEQESKVFLMPWSRLRRGTLSMEAGMAEVTLEDGAIRQVNAAQAHGDDQFPARRIEFAARDLTMRFKEKGEIEHLTGDGEARLASLSPTGRTNVRSDRIDLEFDASAEESTLTKAQAFGGAVVESLPTARPGQPPPARRLLQSDAVTLVMRAGGREIERVETHAPGRVDFLPARPGDRKRRMDAFRMWIFYGAHNEIESFRAVDVATRTERETASNAASVALTWSKNLGAEFDPQTGQMTRLEQWPDFRYEEGQRKARSEKANLDAAADVITLTTHARVWDPTGSTDADRIVLEQKSGAFTAEGHVTSTRQPDRKAPASAMLSSDQPTQARAEKMTASDNNRRVTYEGGAVLWQGANRIEAGRIDVDRAKRVLAAHGRVVSQFLDRPKPDPTGKKPPAKSGFLTVRAPDMLYTDEDRLAHYTGGAELVRPGMTVRAREIRAYLRESSADSTLDRAFADGAVRIDQSAPGLKRTATSEHAEFYEKDQQVILTGGEPRLVDSARGATRGRRLMYYADRDRLIVEGAEGQPAVSRLKRK